MPPTLPSCAEPCAQCPLSRPRRLRPPPHGNGSRELTACIIYQVGALKGFLDALGLVLNHVKPHGALFGAAWRNELVARAIARAANSFGVPLMGMSGTDQEKWYQEEGVEVIWETYVDLDYTDDGEIVITRQHDPVSAEAAAVRALRAARDG